MRRYLYSLLATISVGISSACTSPPKQAGPEDSARAGAEQTSDPPPAVAGAAQAGGSKNESPNTGAAGGASGAGGTLGVAGTPPIEGGASQGGASQGGAAGTMDRGGTTGQTAGTGGTAPENGGTSAEGGVGGSGGTPGSDGESGEAGTSSANAGSAGMDSGPLVHSGLPIPPGPGGVEKPSGAAANLKVLHWAGFKSAISYTFDDTNSSQIAHYDDLQALGVRYTFYLQTNKTFELDNAVWARAVADGHEIGNHTRNHQDRDDAGQDTDAATALLESKFGIEVWTMAAPYGASIYRDIARTRFLLNRGVGGDAIGANDGTDPFMLPCYLPTGGASASEMSAQVDSARSANRWRIFLVHGFTGGTDGAYLPVAFDEFATTVNHSKSLGDVWIDSVVAIGAYWRGQKTFLSVTPTTDGDETTWTWTLPAHFPPGQYLRVTVDGGTLEQGDTTLEWHGHGYYEAALDAGTLTLSP